MNITESIKFDKLESENETLKKEVAEKDKEINVYIDILKNSDKEKTERNELKYQLQEKDKKIVKLKEEQLYKEDFYLLCEENQITYDWESLQTDEITIEMHLKYCESNNHRYCLIKPINNLPSKDVK